MLLRKHNTPKKIDFNVETILSQMTGVNVDFQLLKYKTN